MRGQIADTEKPPRHHVFVRDTFQLDGIRMDEPQAPMAAPQSPRAWAA
jgi:hypothetical protein